MKSIKALALAAVFAAGTSTFGLTEDAAPDSIINYEPVFGTYFVTTPATGYVPQTVTPSGFYVVPASQWIANRFNSNRVTTVEENYFLRVEAANAGSGSD